MRNSLILLFIFFCISSACLQAQEEEVLLVIKNVTLIDGTGFPPAKDQAVVIRDGEIECVGECEEPAGAEVLDGTDKFLIPGLIDAHVHYMSSGWLDTFNMVDVSEEYPYEETIAELKAQPERFHRSYLCSGVTAVFDTGGFLWSLDMEDRHSTLTDAPHLATAGPLMTFLEINIPEIGGSKFWIYLEDEEEIRSGVAMLAERGADAVKLHRPDEARSEEEVYRKVNLLIEVAEREGLPVIANVPELEVAKTAVRAGVSVLVYSIEDELVDEEFLALARERDLVYIPSLGVADSFRAAAEGDFSEENMPMDCVDPITTQKVLLTNDVIKAKGKNEELGVNRNSYVPTWADELKQNRIENLRRIHAAGITVATGSSSGAPLMLHGPGTANEMRVMVEAGLTPMEVLVATTKNGAKAMGRNDIGTIEEGKVADLVLLSANPLEDISNVRAVEVVIHGGKIWKE